MEKASKFFYPKNRSGNVEIDTENLTNLFINSSRKELTYKIRRGIYWGAIMGTLALAANYYEEKTVTTLFSISAGLSGLSSIGAGYHLYGLRDREFIERTARGIAQRYYFNR